MSQYSTVISDSNGINFLSNLNKALETLKTHHSGAEEPAETTAFMLWVDTASGYVKQRNEANDGWVVRWKITNGELAPVDSPVFTGSIGLPVWDNETRPELSDGVHIGFNIDIAGIEMWVDDEWVAIVDIAVMIHSATSKTTPVDADEIGIWDSVASTLKKVTFSNLWNYIKAKADLVYSPISGRPSFSAYRSGSNQSVTSGVDTKIQYNTEEWDTTSAYDNSTNYRFKPTVAGTYHVSACVDGGGTSTASVCAVLYKNGSAYKRGNELRGYSGRAIISCYVQLNGSTDYIEIYANIVAASPVLNQGSNTSYFQAHYISGV